VKVISEMSRLPELKAALHELVGSRATEIGRTVNMVELGFDKGGETYRMHIQCAFRAVREELILIGTADMSFPRDDTAFDSRATRYDRNATMLTDRFQAGVFQVTEVKMSDSGSFVIELSHGVRLEAMPTCSGPFEAWRLFVKGDIDRHFVYPESSDYDGYPHYADADWPAPV
jgi:hypothetical protein